METAANKTWQLQGSDPGEETVNCTSPDNQLTDCYRCGRSNHTSALCPFKNSRCHNCGKLGHIKDVCRSAPKGNYEEVGTLEVQGQAGGGKVVESGHCREKMKRKTN